MTGSIPAANMTLIITPPGGAPTDYSHNLAYTGASQSMTLNQQFGRQGDTAMLPLVDDYQGQSTPNFYIPVLSQVSLYDHNASTYVFAGVVNDPTLVVTGTNRNEWALSCTDYTFYADNALVKGTFNGMTIDQVVVEITAQAGCGITAASVASGGFVAPAPSIATISFNYVTLAAAWKQLAQLASQSAPYGWYVDQNLALHFVDPTTAINSGVTFTTSLTTGGSTTEGHVYEDTSFGYEWDGTTIHNLILIQGATQTIQQPVTGNVTDTWVGNGGQTAWPLKFTPSSIVRLTVSGVQTTVTMLNPGTTATADQTWVVTQNANGQWFLVTQGNAPGNGVKINMWYNYQVPVIAQASSPQSQATYTGPNNGMYAEYINDTTLTSVSMALARALRERTEYAFAAERTTFTTSEDWLGWVRAGQTFQYVNQYIPDAQNGYTWGLNDQFIVVSNSVSYVSGTGGYRQMAITAVRV